MGKFGVLGAAAQNKDPELVRKKKEEIVVANGNGLFLPEEVDLTGLGEMSEEDLVELIEEDLDAIEQLEAQSFRHAVRAAAAFHELEQRAREISEAAGEKFKKVRWAEQALLETFKGRIAPRTMRLYQRVAQPKNIERARELEAKIQKLREIRETNLPVEDFGNAVAKKGIPHEEVSIIPEEFSLRALDRYIRECDRKEMVASIEDRDRSIEPQIKISIEAPQEILDELEMAMRKAMKKFARIPSGATEETSKDRASKLPGSAKRKFSFPAKLE